jgi:Xaa-Pro dipeptidase
MTVKESQPQVDAVRAAMRENDAAAFLTLDPDQQTWLAGFRALIYSRPIILALEPDRSTLIVPQLEYQHAKEHARVDRILAYGERPGLEIPGSHLELLDEFLADLPEGGRVAVDETRMPLGIAQHLSARGRDPVSFAPSLRALQEDKHAAEIEAVRRAGKLISVGVEASLAACRPGITEIEVDATGASAMLAAIADVVPDASVELLTMTPSGSFRSTLPHVFSSTRRLREGDVLIHTRQLAVDGYRAELERTAFVGRPSAEQADAFEAMSRAQQRAIEALAPGVPALEVDRAALGEIEAAGYGEHAIHRTGHGIAVGVHEYPHIRYDNPEPLRPGMVVTIEPGFYVPGLGGFRHSDTFAITETGAEALTCFPSSLEEMSLGG